MGSQKIAVKEREVKEMPLIGAVADDLTGATTTGVLLARSKARTAVFFNVEAATQAEGVEELDAIIISSNSRPLPANEAYDKVKEATIALKNMGGGEVFPEKNRYYPSWWNWGRA